MRPFNVVYCNIILLYFFKGTGYLRIDPVSCIVGHELAKLRGVEEET